MAPGSPLTTRAVIEAEREVLATCLIAPAARAELLDWLTPDDFSRPEHASAGAVVDHQATLAALIHAGGWRQSSYSQGANDRMEITTAVAGWVGVREGQLGASSPLLPFSTARWTAFREDILAG